MFKRLSLGLWKKGKVTTKYPKKPYIPFERTQGAPIIDRMLCTHSGECAKICPTNAIEIGSDSLTIDIGRCIFCGACIKVCPKQAIKMSQLIELASIKKTNLKVKF